MTLQFIALIASAILLYFFGLPTVESIHNYMKNHNNVEEEEQ